MRKVLAVLAIAMLSMPAASADEYPPMSNLLRRIGGCESSGSPRGPLVWDQINRQGRGGRPLSSASGAFQILDGTWDGYGGYQRALHAPPSVQVAKANQLLASRMGARHWRASIGCWG